MIFFFITFPSEKKKDSSKELSMLYTSKVEYLYEKPISGGNGGPTFPPHPQPC